MKELRPARTYRDRLVELSEGTLLFRRYYFPFGTKQIRLTDIEQIEVIRHPRRYYNLRIHGSGDLRTWFPCDWRRPWRDRTFILKERWKWRRVGFTVENPELFEQVITTRKLPVTQQPPKGQIW